MCVCVGGAKQLTLVVFLGLYVASHLTLLHFRHGDGNAHNFRLSFGLGCLLSLLTAPPPNRVCVKPRSRTVPTSRTSCHAQKINGLALVHTHTHTRDNFRLVLCAAGLAVALGTMLLVPFTILGHEAMASYGDSWYVKWISYSLILGTSCPGMERIGEEMSYGKLLFILVFLGRGVGMNRFVEQSLLGRQSEPILHAACRLLLL